MIGNHKSDKSLAQKRSKKGELGSFHTLNGLYVFEKG